MASATILLSDLTLPENPADGTVIGVLTVQGANDGETFTYQLDDNPGDRFAIELNDVTGDYELVVKTGGDLFDFEDNKLNHFSIAITATDGQGTDIATTSFAITVTDNTAPTDLSLLGTSVAEDATAGTVVGSLTADDPDQDETFIFTLTDDAGGRFDIQDGKLVVKDGSLLDYLSAPSHQIEVRVTDSDGNTFEKTLTINVADVVGVINGTSKGEKLNGTAGADEINGGAGADKIYGYGGNDILNGGTGKDILYGGDGKDIFIFNAALKKGEFDQVMDFVSADDTIKLGLNSLQTLIKSGRKKDDHPSKGDDDGFKKGKSASSFSIDKAFKKGKLEKQFFTIGTGSKDSNDFIYYNKKNGFVYLDVDGSGSAKAVEILKLKPGTSVSADDFVFI